MPKAADVEALQWAIGILVTIQTLVTGFLASQLWAHVKECGGVTGTVSRIDTDVERMKADIGTHDSGMRGEIHRQATMLTQHELRLTSLEHK